MCLDLAACVCLPGSREAEGVQPPGVCVFVSLVVLHC